MDSVSLLYLSQQIQEEMKKHEEDLSLGKSKDFAEYKWQAGILRGLRIANGIIADTAQRMKEEDDE